MRKITSVSVVVALLSLFGQNTFTQETVSNQLKLYTNFSWGSTVRTIGIDTISNKPVVDKFLFSQLGYFSPAFAFATAKGNFHEIELSKLQFNQTDETTYIDLSGEFPQIIAGERQTNIFIALRYEYNLFFFKKKEDKKLLASLGFSVQPFYSRSILLPKLSNEFPSIESNVGALFSIVPRLNYKISKRWFLDLNVPLNFTKLKVRTWTVDNPILEVNQRTITTIDAVVMPSEYLIRFGVGLRL